MTPQREAEIRALLVTETYLVAMPKSQSLAWSCVRELLAGLDEARRQGAEHRCAPSPSIQEALNSGDGSYRP